MIEESTQQKPLVIPLSKLVNLPEKDQLLDWKKKLKTQLEEIRMLRVFLEKEEGTLHE